jgi:hypothetical protein
MGSVHLSSSRSTCGGAAVRGVLGAGAGAGAGAGRGGAGVGGSDREGGLRAGRHLPGCLALSSS